MNYEVFHEGKIRDVLMSEEVCEFLESRSVSRTDQARVARILLQLADHGEVINTERFNSEGHGLYAVKANQVRVYGWFSQKEKAFFVCAHGIIKKRQKARKEDLERVIRLRNEFEEERGDDEK